jgi:hypothetical protein
MNTSKTNGGNFIVRVQTYELQQPGAIKYYKDLGFHWLRRYHPSFIEGLRNPTVGCYVDLLLYRDADTIPIDSSSAINLIYRIAP